MNSYINENKRYFGEPNNKKNKKKYLSIIEPDNNDGSHVIESDINQELGYKTKLRHTTSIFSSFNSESELINTYRDISEHPDVDFAIEEITNEMFVTDGHASPVTLNLDAVDFLSDEVKETIHDEFSYILQLLNFNTDAFQIFKNYYIDSRLYYMKIVDPKREKNGIVELKYVNPVSIRKVKDIKYDRGDDGKKEVANIDEFYVYYPQGNAYEDTKNENGFGTLDLSTASTKSNDAYVIMPKAIATCNSGLYDHRRGCVKGHLHKAVKSLNDLLNLETHMIIYRVARAPERRVFYIDTGDLPPKKAQQYINMVQDSYRRDVTYDTSSGRINSEQNTISMHEDYWLSRNSSGKGTEIDTLSGAQNLNQIEDVEYFKEKFIRSLNVPKQRFDGENGATVIFGTQPEMTRPELAFSKFIGRMRSRFNMFFSDILGTQLLLKKTIGLDEWQKLINLIVYEYVKDSHSEDSRNNSIFSQKLELLKESDEFVGKYYSKKYVWKSVMKFTDEQIEEEKKQMKLELENGEVADPNEF